MIDKSISIHAYWKWLAVILWMIVIYSFSQQPYSGAVTAAYLGPYNMPVRKLAHILEYFILCLLSQSAFASCGDSLNRNRLAFALLLSVTYAASDEWHQSFIPGRSASGGDVLVDASGAILAVGVAVLSAKLTLSKK